MCQETNTPMLAGSFLVEWSVDVWLKKGDFSSRPCGRVSDGEPKKKSPPHVVRRGCPPHFLCFPTTGRKDGALDRVFSSYPSWISLEAAWFPRSFGAWRPCKTNIADEGNLTPVTAKDWYERTHTRVKFDCPNMHLRYLKVKSTTEIPYK